jgi:predicted DNA-binding transcriptional regulator AlpA
MSPCIEKPATKLSFSIDEFCAAHGISRAFFYVLMNRGKAPRIMQVEGRKLISVEAAADWRREREAASQVAA